MEIFISIIYCVSDGLQLLYDDTFVLRMIGIWQKVRLMTIYVEHDIVDDPVDPPLLLNTSDVCGNYVNGNDGDNFVDIEEVEGNNVIVEEGGGNNVSGVEGVFRAAEAVNEGLSEIPVDLIDENEEFLEKNGIKKALLVRTKCLSDGEGDEELERGRELAFKAAGKVFQKLKKKGGKKTSKKDDPSSVPVDDARGDEQDPVPSRPQDLENEAECLKRAVSEEIPWPEHINCARHVFANWIGRTLDRSYEQAYWEIVKADTEEEWQAKVDSLIAKNDTVGKELMQDDKNPRAWSRAFYGQHAKCDMVDNNIYDFLDPCYSSETYMKTYSYSLDPINGPHNWRKLGMEKLLPLLKERQTSRRPKQNRRKRPEDKNVRPGTGSKEASSGKGPAQARSSKGPAVSKATRTANANACAPSKGPSRRVAKSTSTRTSLPGITIRENIAPQSQPMQSGVEDKLKGKRKITVSEVRYKKKSTKGMGLYPNKDGTFTFYNAFDFGNSSKEPAIGTKRGRRSNADPVGTRNQLRSRIEQSATVFMFV
ncbi:hypothetical protein COLO4_16680 [Corchorus olitorius]|uniref:Uncharacterized protein n=1 Tax=Corchorus olitorius TaxID=93759 RepID=A0A1R3JG59_9ROSI|nr:hypothetical protein COLO4_16680 [Corchorus olitorius]